MQAQATAKIEGLKEATAGTPVKGDQKADNSKSPAATPRPVSPTPAERVQEVMNAKVDPVTPSDTKKSAADIRREFFKNQRKLPKFKLQI